ncbi:MAG: hypothetical protein GY754_12745 [bacterium]|nr:hypothetical protein [bacterium]
MFNKIIFSIILLLSTLAWEPFHHIICHEHEEGIQQEHHGAEHCCFSIDHLTGQEDSNSGSRHCLNHSQYVTPDNQQQSSTTKLYTNNSSLTLKPEAFYAVNKPRLYNSTTAAAQRLKQNITHTVLLN